MILTEKTKNKSYCCNRPIYIEKICDKDGSSERPYCSKCLKFPEASPEAKKRVKHLLDTGQVCDHKFDKWKEEYNFVKLATGKWFSPDEAPEGTPSSPMVKDCNVRQPGINLSPEYTDKELYDKFKNETLLDNK